MTVEEFAALCDEQPETDGYRDSRLPDFVTPRPQHFFWRHGFVRTGNAFSTLRFWLWRLGGGSWGV